MLTPTAYGCSANNISTTNVSFKAVLTVTGDSFMSAPIIITSASPLGSFTIPDIGLSQKTFTVNAVYTLSLPDGSTLGTYSEKIGVINATPYAVDGPVLTSGGGTLKISAPINNYTARDYGTFSATIFLNGTKFDPGHTVAVTASDPTAIVCTNGAGKPLYINYDVYKIGSLSPIYSERKTGAVLLHPLVNQPTNKLTPGYYYLVASYYAYFTTDHVGIWYDVYAGSVIIPFTVNGTTTPTILNSLTSPTVTQKNGLCDNQNNPEVQLAWNSVPSANAYAISRSKDGIAYSPIASSLSTTTTSFTDKNITVGDLISIIGNSMYSFRYQISAVDSSGNASTTNISVTFPSCSTTPPNPGVPTCSLTTQSTPISQNASNVQLDWNSSGADICTGTGFSTGAGGPTGGTASVNDMTSTTTFTLRCTNHATGQSCYSSATVSPTVNNTIDIGLCNPPKNALPCSGSDVSSSSPTTLVKDSASCQSVNTPIKCEFYCDSANGYTKKGNVCSKSNTTEF